MKKIVEVARVILLRRFPRRLLLTKIQHRVNSWNFCFICFSILFRLVFFLVLLFKRKSLEFTGPCLTPVSVSFVYGWWYFVLVVPSWDCVCSCISSVTRSITSVTSVLRLVSTCPTNAFFYLLHQLFCCARLFFFFFPFHMNSIDKFLSPIWFDIVAAPFLPFFKNKGTIWFLFLHFSSDFLLLSVKAGWAGDPDSLRCPFSTTGHVSQWLVIWNGLSHTNVLGSSNSSNRFLILILLFIYFFILIIQDEVEVDTTIGIDQTTRAVLVGVAAVAATRMLLPTTIRDSSSADAAAVAADTATISQTGMLLLSIVQYIFDYLALRGAAHF